MEGTAGDSSADMGKGSERSRTGVLAVVVLLLTLVAVGLGVGLYHVVTAAPETVSVSGSVTSTNSRFSPDSITFIETKSATRYDAYVPSGWTVRSHVGTYSIILPDMHDYYVVTTVENATGFVGGCSQEATNLLQLYASQRAPLTFNVQC